jgi:hypothetical protein
MSKTNDELDEFGKKVLSPLSEVPSLDPKLVAAEKEKYILKVESYRQEILTHPIPADIAKSNRPGLWLFRSPILVKVLFGALLAVFILVGSGISVYAAQGSVPGDVLYPIKSLSEDIRLLLPSSPQSKLDLTLNYTDRRVGEIAKLVSNGEKLTNQASERYTDQMENALLLAAKLDDADMQKALEKIKKQAESQGMTLEELIAKLPDQASPAIFRMQQKLKQQVELSTFGENNPEAFRHEIRQRLHLKDKNSTPGLGSEATSLPSATATPGHPGGGNNPNNGKPTHVPGDNGQGGSNPGNGNHSSSKTQTP